MTITNNFAAKLTVAVVASAMILSAFASTVKAQTTEELQEMINDLLAQVSTLQGQLGGDDAAATTGGSCTSIAAPLTIGSTGADVTALQERLIAAGQSIPAGATGYFGTQTQAALAAWQAANGVSPAAGYYGPITMAAMDAACVPADDSDDDSTDDSDDDSDSEDVELSGEASLDSFEIDSASDDQIEEGAEDAEIAEVTLEFADGDAEISRIDVALVGAGDEVDPWDTFETISLWVDGDMVAEATADDEDEYLDEDDGSLRFSGLDIVAMEDEELDITIAATVQGSVDGTDDSEAWTVQVDAVRYFDADGVASTDTETGDMGDTVDFTVEEAGYEDEVVVKTSSEDPDATTLQVEDDSKSDWYTVFVFDLDTDDSINDISLNTVAVNVATTGATYSTLVDDAELVIDGTTIDDVSVVATGNEAVLTFDVDGDVEIAAGERVAAELKLRFNSLDSGDEGATVQGSITTDNVGADVIDAEGADDLETANITGAATGEEHTLRTMGIEVEVSETDADVTTGDGALDDYATYTIEVDVTAFEQDVYIDTDDTDSLNWTLENSAGTAIVNAVASSTVVLSSTADDDDQPGYFKVSEGETETFTIQVTFDPEVANIAARLQLDSIVFDDDASSEDQTWTAAPASDYRTAVVTIVN